MDSILKRQKRCKKVSGYFFKTTLSLFMLCGKLLKQNERNELHACLSSILVYANCYKNLPKDYWPIFYYFLAYWIFKTDLLRFLSIMKYG